MTTNTFAAIQTAAVAAAVLAAGIAAFQLALMAGAPLGDAVFGGSTLTWITWVIVVFLALNTVANLAAPHPVERWVMGSITLLLTGISLALALRAPGLT